MSGYDDFGEFGEFPYTKCGKELGGPPQTGHRAMPPMQTITPRRFAPKPVPLRRTPEQDDRFSPEKEAWASRVLKSRTDKGWGGGSEFGRQLNFAPTHVVPGWPTPETGPLFPYANFYPEGFEADVQADAPQGEVEFYETTHALPQDGYFGEGAAAPPAAAPPAPPPGATDAASAAASAASSLLPSASASVSLTIDPAEIINSVVNAAQSERGDDSDPVFFTRDMHEDFIDGIREVRKSNDKLRDLNVKVKYWVDERVRLRAESAEIKHDLLKRNVGKAKWDNGIYKNPAAQARQARVDYIEDHRVTASRRARYNHAWGRITVLKGIAQRQIDKRFRTDLVKNWVYLLNVEGLRPIFELDTVTGTGVLMAAGAGDVIDPDNLTAIFPRHRDYPYLQLRTESHGTQAKRGIVPAVYRDPLVQRYLNYYQNGYISANYFLPPWILGVAKNSDEERLLGARAFPVGMLVAAVNRNLLADSATVGGAVQEQDLRGQYRHSLINKAAEYAAKTLITE